MRYEFAVDVTYRDGHSHRYGFFTEVDANKFKIAMEHFRMQLDIATVGEVIELHPRNVYPPVTDVLEYLSTWAK